MLCEAGLAQCNTTKVHQCGHIIQSGEISSGEIQCGELKCETIDSTEVLKFGATLHYGASNIIKEIEVSKKCPKVEPYFGPIFDPIVVKPCLDDAK